MSTTAEYSFTSSENADFELGDHVSKLLSAGEPDIYRQVIQEVDRHILRKVMRYCHENQFRAAQRLGISRMTLRSKLRALGILEIRRHKQRVPTVQPDCVSVGT